ncbi:hypothetical protein ABC977_16525 [Thioalkalicoccus limnaeus]|uniref:Uncharacterized protein n=1 Tax=Thioalkalicoccus limnaeus TaxID=120681 RepID=A0ABV4BHK1_9GAMM
MRLVATLLNHQASSEILGNLCEIGAQHGRLSSILALPAGAMSVGFLVTLSKMKRLITAPRVLAVTARYT